MRSMGAAVLKGGSRKKEMTVYFALALPGIVSLILFSYMPMAGLYMVSACEWKRPEIIF